jgi:hypothetical protein
MKSSQLEFANPDLNGIDFKIIPNSPHRTALGILYAGLNPKYADSYQYRAAAYAKIGETKGRKRSERV